MKRRLLFPILTLLGLLFIYRSYADEAVGVLSFSQNDYHGARQNWSVSTGKNGLICFANHSGLLEFDGKNWTMHYLPSKTIVRAVKVANDSVIYTGGYMELGFWKPDASGELTYHSLTPVASSFFMKNVEFWNIALKENFVYYQSFSQILAYHNDSVFPVEIEGQISVMNNVHDRILVAIRNRGIFELVGDSCIPFLQDEKLLNKQVKFMIPFQNNQLLIGTAAHGILLWDGNQITEWNSQWNDYFIKNELNRAYSTADNKVIVGTLIDGIVVFDSQGKMLFQVNAESGLSNSTVLGIETDEWQNIWLALDVGIGFVAGTRERGFIIESLPDAGAVYAAALFDKQLYLGTNQGLFVKDPDPGSHQIRLLPGTQDQIWELKVIDNELLVGHNQGTFSIRNGALQQISTESGGFSFVNDPLNDHLVLQSTYNSLVVFEKTGSGVRFRNRIQGFTDLIRYIVFDHVGNLWAGHMHRGVYKIALDDGRRNVINSEYYGENLFGKDRSIHVFVVENRIVFTTGEKIYTYDDLKDSIIVYDKLNSELGKFASSNRIVSAPDHHYWFIQDESIGLFSIIQDEVKLLKEFPVSLFNDPFPVKDFENILPVTDYLAILCLQNGIAYLDASVTNHASDLIRNYAPTLRKLEISNNRDRKTALPVGSKNIRLKYTSNNIAFRFAFPMINELPVYFQYHMEGLDHDWSKKSNLSEFSFVRMPQGEFLLKVKAVDSWGNESKVFSLPIVVEPPFYASRWAIGFYTLLMISALLIFRSWGIRQTRRKEQRQSEAREKELIRLRNEKLQNEVQFKSKELANSTMANIKKNEFLLELKNVILRQKNELGSRYPDKYFNYLNTKIDENISSQDDWKIFENNFERAHEQFFKKMKEQFPDLTSSDLQLCAYLRMNLSSKEIAPLLGISVRGVENHRYRLRKKMNLEHDNSLTNMILSL